MKVYHGSDTLVSVIDLQKCKPNRDFGRGFYVTKLRSQADDMAIRVTRYSKKSPVVSEYEFDEYAFENNELQVLRFDNYDEQWLDYKPQIDINFIIGSIAEPLVEQLMLDLQIDEIQAADMFYSSATFTQLANPDTKLYEKEWQEIYQMLMIDKEQ
ncbi:hypothetical protein FACS1894195_4940 [Bacteroidia bacterium]|nr:hypothetical protein FACS1894195_4940 [Bacteroidia bacterium]